MDGRAHSVDALAQDAMASVLTCIDDCPLLLQEQTECDRLLRWEAAIHRVQAVLSCSVDCPLAPFLLNSVRNLAADNPLCEAFPELR